MEALLTLSGELLVVHVLTSFAEKVLLVSQSFDFLLLPWALLFLVLVLLILSEYE
jgi:hypothetical protein